MYIIYRGASGPDDMSMQDHQGLDARSSEFGDRRCKNCGTYHRSSIRHAECLHIDTESNRYSGDSPRPR